MTGRHGARALLALGLLLLVIAVNYQWAPSLGDNRSEVCRSQAAPTAVASSDDPEVWLVEAVQTWFPLGVTCRWTHPTDGTVSTTGPGWGPSLVGAAGLLLVVRSLLAFRRAPAPRDV